MLAPLYPAAFEAFDLRAFDTIVSTTTSWSKGVRFRADATHVCYIHTVSRFVFAYDQYVGGLAKSVPARWFAQPLVRRLAVWDRLAAQRPTAFIANSHNVARRVRQYYARDAFVVPCPVDVDRFTVGTGGDGAFLVVSRLLPYKRIDLAIAACALARVPLKIVGSGPAEGALKAAAAGTRTEFLGNVADDRLHALLGSARAIVLPGEEDFGLVPLEANASGRAAIAYGRGGALETIRPGVTGEYFLEPTPESLAAVLRDFEPERYDAGTLRAHAETFRPERFKKAFGALVAAIVRSRATGEPVQQP